MRKVTLLSYLTLKNVTPTFLRNIWQLNSFFIVVKYLIWRIFFGKMNPIYFDCPSSHTEKAMAPHSSTLAWKIPWTEERGRLQSVGSLRVGHDWAASLSLSLSSHKNLDTECSLWMKLVILFFSWFPPVGLPSGSHSKEFACNMRDLGWEDPLEEGVATHSSIIAWRIPMDSGAWWLQYLRSQRVGHYWATKYSTLPPVTPFSLEKKYDILPKLRWKELVKLTPMKGCMIINSSTSSS